MSSLPRFFCKSALAFVKPTQTVERERESVNSVIGQDQLWKKKKTQKQKKYHYEKVCPIERCLKVSRNLGEQFRSKTHNLIPRPEYYRLLKIARRYEPLNPSADAEFSPKEHLKRKYHSVKVSSF